jgi:hypothetical protein
MPGRTHLDLYGVELRVLQNGELYLSEVFRDHGRLHARTMAS